MIESVSRNRHILMGTVILSALMAAGSARAEDDCAAAGVQDGYTFTEVDRIFGCGCCCDQPTWQTFTDWQVKLGDRFIGQADFFVPLWQDHQTLVYTDLRGSFDDDDGGEGNFGLGLRKLVDCQQIFGAYAYYDARFTQFNNSFDQATVGIEWMTVDWEARANGYIPEGTGKLVNSLTTAEFSAGTIQIRNGVERAYYGFDAEIGALLKCWGECGDVELRGFLGGFHFDNDHPGFRNLSGPRGRLELRLYDLDFLGHGSRLVLAGEIQWDQVRETTGFGIVELRIPLNFYGPQRKMSRIERRMVDRVVRDIDVITLASQNPAVPAINAETGQPFGPVTVVNANTADVPGTVAAAGANSTVIADGTQGQINIANSIMTANGQTVRGAGFTVSGPDGSTAPIGTRPTINGTNAANDVFVITDNTTIRGLDVTGGRDGINGTAVNGFTVTHVNVSNTGGDGLHLNGSNSGTITFNSFSDNNFNALSNGLDIVTFSGGTISNNTFRENTGHNALFGTISGGTITDNMFLASTTGPGVSITTFSGGSFLRNTAQGNGNDAADHGFFVGTLSGGSFSNNTARLNRGDGFNVPDVTGGMFNNNVSNNNMGNGFTHDATPMGGATASGNSASGNGGTNTAPAY